MADWTRTASDHLWLPYTQMKTADAPLPVVATEGVRLKLADGRALIDGIGSWWVAVHGYNHPKIIGAVQEQIARMPHVMLGGLVNEPAATLAAKLAAMTPGDLNRVFFAESGSVAVEVAMKMAVQAHHNRGVSGRTRFVCFRDGYHGDTAATMSVCDPDEGMHTMFKGYLPAQLVCDLPRDEASLAALEADIEQNLDSLAGIVVEPLIQGAGGMKFHDASVLKRLRAVADRFGLYLIFDEIFTGLGRTGTLFACEAAGVVPDVMTLSKALTGGVLPLSATIATERLFREFWSDDPLSCLMHGPTYMGHAGACAAALASLELFETEPRLNQVKAIEGQLEAELAALRGMPGIRDVRVKGAVGVVQLDSFAATKGLGPKFVEKGVWVRPFRDIVYLAPAYNIDADDLSRLTGAIRDVLTA